MAPEWFPVRLRVPPTWIHDVPKANAAETDFDFAPWSEIGFRTWTTRRKRSDFREGSESDRPAGLTAQRSSSCQQGRLHRSARMPVAAVAQLQSRP
jgi:hypothetical protein